MWKVLIVIEVFVLIGALGNFGVPGSWRQFWEFEAIYVSLAFLIGMLSVFLEKREALQKHGSSTIRLIQRLQIKIFAFGVAAILCLLVLHFLNVL